MRARSHSHSPLSSGVIALEVTCATAKIGLSEDFNASCDRLPFSASPFYVSLYNNRVASWANQQCGFRTGPTQTGLYSHRNRLEA